MYGYAPLSEEQIALLENIDFPWLPQHGNERFWYKEQYDELVQLQKEHGHLLVDYKQNRTLSNWISRQRSKYEDTSAGGTKSLRRSQINLLEQIDFPWTANRL